jgi:hypothetical protein
MQSGRRKHVHPNPKLLQKLLQAVGIMKKRDRKLRIHHWANHHYTRDEGPIDSITGRPSKSCIA